MRLKERKPETLKGTCLLNAHEHSTVYQLPQRFQVSPFKEDGRVFTFIGSLTQQMFVYVVSDEDRGIEINVIPRKGSLELASRFQETPENHNIFGVCPIHRPSFIQIVDKEPNPLFPLRYALSLMDKSLISR